MKQQRDFLTMQRRTVKYFLMALLTGVLLLCLTHIDHLSYAQTRPTRATFDGTPTGTVRVRPNGRMPERTPSEYPELISNGQQRDQLWVAGDNRSSARMAFRNQNSRINPVVQVGNTGRPTLFQFPCWVQQSGSSVFGWGFRSVESACDTVTANVGNTSTYTSHKATSQELANGEIAPSDQITITRLEDLTLIHVYGLEENLAVDIFVGTVRITALNGVTFNVDAGNRYIQSLEEGRVEPLNLNEALESPAIATFLDAANWSSDVNPLLDELKIALQSPSSSPASQQALNADQQEIVDTHNRLRAEVNVPPLTWSAELAGYAQEWADYLSETNSFGHSSGNDRSGAGENIAAGSSVGQMLGLWADEKDDYNGSTGSCRSGRVCGHYTQMVWRNTTEIGCGIAPHRTYGGVMVCNYSPPGNYVGQRPY